MPATLRRHFFYLLRLLNEYGWQENNFGNCEKYFYGLRALFGKVCHPDFSLIFVSMLSKKTKYAFHALTYLGKHRDQKTILIHDIAEEYGISHKFLENILLELKKAGVLGSKKGKGGGYYLIKDPKDIPLSKVIRLLDGPIALLPCVSLNYYEPCVECKNEAACGLRSVMIQVRDEMLNVLENKTLADILDRE